MAKKYAVKVSGVGYWVWREQAVVDTFTPTLYTLKNAAEAMAKKVAADRQSAGLHHQVSVVAV